MKNKLYFLILVLILFIPLINLFNNGLPITHDGQDHVARIANFYQNLHEGNIVPRWAANLNWGYGHPILMFLYPLSSYFASLFHLLGFSFVDSTKLVFGFAFVLSGITMYLWIKEFLSKEAAIVGALLYTFAPYRFVDLYVRGAIGEHMAFVFPPLVLYFLYKLSKKYSFFNLFGGALSLAFLILAHNAISLMFIPIILFYICFLAWTIKWKKAFIINSFLLIIFGFSMSAFFWMPAFFEGKYTLRDIVTSDEALSRFVTFQQLLYGPWSYGITGQFTVQIGIIQWIGVLLSLPLGIHLFKIRNKNWLFVFTMILFFAFSLFIMTSESKFVWEIITTLKKFQFPWRFLSLSVFLSAFLGAYVFSVLSNKLQKIVLFIIILFLVFLNKDFWEAKAYMQKPEVFYSGTYDSTTDTGESAPIWSVRFMEHKPKAHIEVLEGASDVVEQDRKSTYHEYVVSAFSKTKLRENTLYFPGWKVLVDGREVNVEFQDPNNRGLMTFWVEKGEHKVIVEFKETKLRQIADFVSVISLFVLLSLGILYKKIWRN